MSRTFWRCLEILPMLIYVSACVAWSAYFLCSFMAVHVQQTLAPLELAGTF